jgi:hypothetical protein
MNDEDDDEALKKLFARRAEAQPPLRPEIWRGVEVRIARKKMSRPAPWLRVAAMAPLAGLAAAAALFLYMRPQHPVAHHRIAPEDALAQAEAVDRAAVAELEARWRSLGAPDDPRLAQARAHLDEERARVGGDIDGRLALLDGYEDYLHSLQEMVDEPTRKP